MPLIKEIMLFIGTLKPRETDFVQEDVKAVDMTPWKHGKTVGVILAIIVGLIYVIFADFSALKKDHNIVPPMAPETLTSQVDI